MVIGNNKYFVALSVDFKEFKDENKTVVTTAYDVENMVEHLKLDIIEKIPQIQDIYIDVKDHIRNNKI